MSLTLDQLRHLVRTPAKHAASVAKSLSRENRHKAKAGSCWAYIEKCADLKGKVATCHDSGDPRCAG